MNAIVRKLIQNKHVLISGVLSIILILPFYNYIDSGAYIAETNDKPYYLSVAEELDETGRLQDGTVQPHESVRSTQNGLIFVYTLFRQFTTDNELITLLTSITAFILLALSLYVIFKIARYVGLSELESYLCVLFVSLNGIYFHTSIKGLTESFFYPAAMLWVYYHIKCISDTESPRLTTWLIFGIISYFLMQFRVQALLLFFSSWLYFLLRKEWNKSLKASFIYGFSLAVVLSLSYIFSDNILGPGEVGHLGNISKSKPNFGDNLILFIQYYVTNYAAPYTSLKGILLISISFTTLGVVVFRGFKNLVKTNINNDTFLFLCVIISIIALFLFKQSPLKIRYIYYTSPLYIILLFKFLKVARINIIRRTIVICIFLIFTTLSYVYYKKHFFEHYAGKDRITNNVESYYTIKHLYQTYKPNNVYMLKAHDNSRRIIYAATGQPVVSAHGKKEFADDSFLIIDQKYMNKNNIIPSIDSYSKVGEYYYFWNGYTIYYIH